LSASPLAPLQDIARDLAASFASLVLPRYANAVIQWAGILEAGELPIIFWLLIWGAKQQRGRGL
jgi:hypothetical protein